MLMMTGTERAPGMGSLRVATPCKREQAEQVIGQLLFFVLRQPGAALAPSDALDVGDDDTRHPFGVDVYTVAQRDAPQPGERSGLQRFAQLVSDGFQRMLAHISGLPRRRYC